MKLLSYSQFAAIALAAVGLLSGCTKSEGIRSYQQPKLHRTLGAVLVHEGQVWFFKASGSNAELRDQVDNFRNLLKSVRFDDPRQPTWDLPDGWDQSPGGGMRFATIEIAVDSEPDPIQLTVSPLPVMGDEKGFILANINRWRDQIRLDKISEQELPHASEQVPVTSGDLVATMINVTGRLRPSTMGGAPFAGAAGQAARPTAAPPEKPTMTHEAPDAWQPGELVVERMGIAIKRDAVFDVQQNDERVEITVTSMPASRGMLLPNVNRWRGQVGLPPISEADLEAGADEFQIAGDQATYVTLTGDSQTILGMIAEHAGYSWFIKLQGDPALVAQEKERFETFAGSIAFE